jgi:predicted transcriptional regulator
MGSLKEPAEKNLTNYICRVSPFVLACVENLLQKEPAMADVTFSVRLPEATKVLLDSLSKSTNRSKNFLAREAITHFVESEAQIVEGIMQGIDDVRGGRTVAHEDVKRKSRAIIKAAVKRRAVLA